MSTLIVLAMVASVINPFHDIQLTARITAQIPLRPLELFVPPVERFDTHVALATMGDYATRGLVSCTAGS
jgi:hypothetical protein